MRYTVIMHGTEYKLTAILRHFTIVWFYKEMVVMNQMWYGLKQFDEVD